MKIGFIQLELPEGKVKYNDPRMAALAEKCQPKKITPFYVELIRNEYIQSEALVVHADAILDVLIQDIEKCEVRAERSTDAVEKTLMDKCIGFMEQEKPLCECDFTAAEKEELIKFGLISTKPVLQIREFADVDEVICKMLEKASIMFFYTAGPKEVHAWSMPKGSDIVACAGKIHTDLARGFIKGDIASFDHFMQCHSFNDCKKQGLIQVVDRGHVVQDGDVIEIRFNV